MKKIFVLCFFYLSVTGMYAHETNAAFYKISQKDSTVEIQVEFPWALRNALLVFNPSLENATSNKDFEHTFVEYLRANLVLTNNTGDHFEFLNFKEVKNEGHTHQNSYTIIFEGKDLAKIKNTMMFNVFDNQVNLHEVTIDAKQKTFSTSKRQMYFNVEETQYFIPWGLLFLFYPLLFFVSKL